MVEFVKVSPLTWKVEPLQTKGRILCSSIVVLSTLITWWNPCPKPLLQDSKPSQTFAISPEMTLTRHWSSTEQVFSTTFGMWYQMSTVIAPGKMMRTWLSTLFSLWVIDCCDCTFGLGCPHSWNLYLLKMLIEKGRRRISSIIPFEGSFDERGAPGLRSGISSMSQVQ